MRDYHPSDEIERAAQAAEKNRDRLLAFYRSRPGTPINERHWHLFYQPPGNSQPPPDGFHFSASR